MTDWRYGNSLATKDFIPNYLAIAMIPLVIFLLVSYAVLPEKFTNRHYLSVCFTLGVLFMEIAFIIGLGADPEQCYNDITPNDMNSNLPCAFSGAFLLFGGWCAIIWSFLRTLALHLQVCWEAVLGPKFMWATLILGWGIPIIGLVILMIMSGVSYRFGPVCHINYDNDLYDYWIPILVFAAGTVTLQLTTMGYCIHIYIKSLFDKSPTTNSSNMPSYPNSVRTVTARQAYRRIERVLRLQWRGIALALLIILNAIYFAAIFIEADDAVKPTAVNLQRAQPWVICLAVTQGNKEKCLSYARGLGPNETSLMACLILLSLVGIWNFIFFVRTSMFRGWFELFTNQFSPREEFVSADARTRPTDVRAYEMISNSTFPSMKTPEPRVRSPTPVRLSGARSPDLTEFGRDARYTSPKMSFSTPRPPSSSQHGREWDPQATYARAHHSREPSDLD